ncbi:MAG: 5'-nucleotidase C-terminal domain-containing protein [Chloroflexi bacterium]|nr:5'-nucleotidase C-terminal domain-containing protein [Chloroflexota bacterium]
MSRHLTLLGCLLLLLALLAPAASAQDETFSLTLMHTNDTHTWHEPQGDGNGGVALQAAVVNQIRAEAANSLLLDAGDRFTGTLYQVQYQGLENARIMNQLGYDAMTLGNHEFDYGEDVLQAFLAALEFPVVTANVDFTAFPAIDELVSPYTLLEVGGQQIGVIGITTPDTPIASSPDPDVIFGADLVAAAQAAIDELTAQGVNKIIVLTHIGITADLELVPQLSGADVIIGGHSHTLLSNTYRSALREYPVVLEGADGSPTLYVQSGSQNIYLGRLDVQFDAEGILTRWAGDSILLSRYITPDADAAALMTELSGPIEELRAQPTGATSGTYLVGDRRVCRVEECNLGNLIADAMRLEVNAQIAIMNGGGIRADIDEGEVTIGEVFTVLPFGNTLATFELTGADVIAALENGVSRIALNDAGQIERDGAAGRFPQVSGIRFSFDPTQEAGSRIVSVEVLGADGSYAAIDPAATYSVVSNNFLRQGGDGYSVFLDNGLNAYDFGRPLNDVVVDYMVANSPVSAAVEGRITPVNAEVEPLE